LTAWTLILAENTLVSVFCSLVLVKCCMQDCMISATHAAVDGYFY